MLPVPLFSQSTAFPVSIETILSVFSFALTSYYWLIQARRERPDLRIFQLRSFRASLRRGDADSSLRRLGLTQVEPRGVLIANNSIRQNAIVRFDCFLKQHDRWLQGTWGYVDNDAPPWNIPPESALAMSLACFFDVPENFAVPEDLQFRIEFITVSGKRFPHLFHLKAPPV